MRVENGRSVRKETEEMTNNKEHDKVKCSFCGRDGSEVASMVAGPDVYICDNCVKSSVDILKENIAA